MDESLIDFARDIAGAERLKKRKILGEKEYDNRILSAIRKLNQSSSSQEIADYYLIPIQDMGRTIENAARTEAAD